MMDYVANTQDYQGLQRETSVKLAQHLATVPVDSDRIAQLLQILLNVSELRVAAIAKNPQQP